MELFSAYDVRIKNYHHIFNNTITLYQQAASFFLTVCGKEWPELESLKAKERVNQMEKLTLRTKTNPTPKHDVNA